MPDIPEYHDMERNEPGDTHNPPYMQTGRLTGGWLSPQILRDVELDKRMAESQRQFFRAPIFSKPGEITGLTFGDAVRILNSGYPEESE